MIAFLRDEPGADLVAEALLDSESQCYAHALNLCEVFYDFHRASGRHEALQAIADLARVGGDGGRESCPRSLAGSWDAESQPASCFFG